MPINVPCPACGAQLKAPDAKAGKKARCGKCGEKFRIPSPGAAPSSPDDLEPVPMAGEVDDLELLSAASHPGISSTIPPMASVEPAAPRAEALSLDDDDTPMPAEERFARSQSGRTISGHARSPQAARTDPVGRKATYLRPGERKSRGVLLSAGLLGAVALAGLIAAVIIHQNRKHSAGREPQAAAKSEESSAPPPGEPPRDSTRKTEPRGQEDVARDKVARRPSGVPRMMAALPRGTRAFQLRMPSAKPEFTQNLSGEPFSIEAPFEKVRRIFPQDNRVAHDTVIVWQSNDGIAGLGEQLTVDSYSDQTRLRVKRLEFVGDGKDPRCDLSPDGKHFVAATAAGAITVWNLADESKILQGFDAYADKPEHKKAGLAAVYFTNEPGHLATVSSAGAIHLFQMADRKQLGEFIPPRGLPGRILADKNVAADEARSSIVLAAGGVVYQVATTAPLSVVWQLELGGEVGRSFGIASVGVPGRIAYAFEVGEQKREPGVLFCMPKQNPVIYRWPEQTEEPAGISWSGTNMAVVATSRGAVWVESAEMTFLPVALAEVGGGKSLHRATESYHWYLRPHPVDKTRSLLVALGLPPQDFLEFRDAARAGQPLFTVRLDEKGLWK